ncbi:TetR/AcrR family transcriptional regulator [Nocardia sp. NPDC048505]|uniref:TetR/AcrR family transcriptional regulator n=1 Tax=unclassified Nocardia TaxID=2637762 RepID=UPI0033C4CEAB
MPARTDTRQRVLQTAAELFRRQGFANTGLKQIITTSGAPWGSLYHFFPEGKEQLAEEAMREAGARFEKLMALTLARAADPQTAVRDFFSLGAQALENSDYADGCPIGAVAAEVASTVPRLRRACEAVFASWLERITESLTTPQIPAEDAARLAMVILSMFEGAIVLSRSQRSIIPLKTSGETAAQLVAAAAARANG